MKRIIAIAENMLNFLGLPIHKLEKVFLFQFNRKKLLGWREISDSNRTQRDTKRYCHTSESFKIQISEMVMSARDSTFYDVDDRVRGDNFSSHAAYDLQSITLTHDAHCY